MSHYWKHDTWSIIILLPTSQSTKHKVHTYKEYHSVCPLVEIVTPPPPLSPASVPLTSGTKGGGGGAKLGVGPNSNEWRKSLALCLLCESNCMLRDHRWHIWHQYTPSLHLGGQMGGGEGEWICQDKEIVVKFPKLYIRSKTLLGSCEGLFCSLLFLSKQKHPTFRDKKER
jgi:hypothetical protein